MNQSYHDGFMTKCAQSNLSYETAMQLWDFNTMMKSAQATGVSAPSHWTARLAGKAYNYGKGVWDEAAHSGPFNTVYNTNTGNPAEDAVNAGIGTIKQVWNVPGVLGGRALDSAADGAKAVGGAIANGARAYNQAALRDYESQQAQNEAMMRMGVAAKDAIASGANKLWGKIKGWGRSAYNNVAEAYNNGRQAVEGLGQTLADSERLRQNGNRQAAEADRIQRAKAEYDAARQAQFSNSSPRTQRAAQRANMAGN